MFLCSEFPSLPPLSLYPQEFKPRCSVFSLRLLWPLALSTAATAQERVVNVYNWSDYVDPKALDEFTKQTGIKVVYDTYDNNEIVETKLLAGKSGYDIVVPSGPFLQRLIGAKVFQKLDKAKLPNLANHMARGHAASRRVRSRQPIRRQLHVGHDRHRHQHQEGQGHPRRHAAQHLGSRVEAGDRLKLKACGIYMLDTPEDLFPGVLAYLGLNPDSKRSDDLNKAGDALFRIRGNIQKFHSSEYINALANGDICVAVGYSGDMVQANNRAEEAKNGVEVGYVIPREGALMWFDSFAIPGGRQERRRGARVHQLHDAARDRRHEHELRVLCLRQPRRQAVYRQGDPRQSRHLSGRGHHEAPLHQHRL